MAAEVSPAVVRALPVMLPERMLCGIGVTTYARYQPVPVEAKATSDGQLGSAVVVEGAAATIGVTVAIAVGEQAAGSQAVHARLNLVARIRVEAMDSLLWAAIQRNWPCGSRGERGGGPSCEVR